MSPSAPCFQYNSAIVRTPAKSVVEGLRAEDQGNPDYEGVLAEHKAYIKALESVGMKVTVLPALEEFPDSIFVEDPALVFPTGAICLRPGAITRLGETAAITPDLEKLFDKVIEIASPGYADGGDILVTPKSVMIGLSARTNEEGANALIASLAELGYKGEIANTPEGVLHFKTECSLLDEETILVTKRMDDSGLFADFKTVVLPEGDEPAANAVRINDHVLASKGYPRTIELLTSLGYKVVPVKTSEIQKIDAGISCMSLRWFNPNI